VNKKLTSFFVLFFVASLVFGQTKTESIKINWPDEYKWKVGSDQENDSKHLIEMIPGNETVDNWKTMGTTQILKIATGIPMDSIPGLMFKQAQKMAPDAKLTLFEKDSQAKAPWIIFKVESPEFTSNPRPESQLFYVIEGEPALFINFISLKEKNLSDDFCKKWIGIFKSSELVYK
jgi:hypothetical protein